MKKINKRSSSKRFPKPLVYVFTIIELLVVISIIALLASLLIPALSTAKARTQLTQCLSNLKQIHNASLLYAMDYNILRLPDYAFGTSYWQSTLATNKFLPQPESWTTTYLPGGIWACAAEKIQNTTTLTKWKTWRGTHYGMNIFLSLQPTSSSYYQRWHPKQSLPHPDKVMYFSEKLPGYPSVCSGKTVSDIDTTFRHRGNMPLVFVDGHGETGTSRTIPTYENFSDYAKTFFWCAYHYRDLGYQDF